MGPTPGVATPVVIVGPATDGGVGTAGGALPYDVDFGLITTGSDRDEVTTVASPKKRRSSCGPAHEARRKAFYARRCAEDTATGLAVANFSSRLLSAVSVHIVHTIAKIGNPLSAAEPN